MRILSLTVPFLILIMAGWITDSPHGSEFKISCGVCHSPKGWELDREIYSFDHNTTMLPLEGQHTSINCRLCHPTLVFSDAETDCFRCHVDMHNQTVGPDCARCHTPMSWIVQNITEIHQRSRFPLQGPHYMANCLDCHPSASLLRFEPLGVECIDCHMQDYQSVTEPNHVLGNFSTECIDCHSMTAFEWAESGFVHSFFPLTQGHALYDCNLCHNGTDYSDISPECYACHQEDYVATTDPGHVASNFPTDCQACHTTMPGWKPVIFDHTSFPLTQGHANLDCSQCHDVNNYANISPECFACHQEDYNNTTNPSHAASGLSTECQQCHSTLPGWKPATFTVHDGLYFPIYSGEHKGEWNSCTECHSDPSNYAQFSCLNCHEHNRQEMDDKHSGEDGYEYNSIACLQCHPAGKAD